MIPERIRLHFPGIARRIEVLRAELRDSWGKAASYVAEREAELRELIERYSGPEPAPEDV